MQKVDCFANCHIQTHYALVKLGIPNILKAELGHESTIEETYKRYVLSHAGLMFTPSFSFFQIQH